MKGLSGKVSRTLTLGTQLTCSDNSGAKVLNIIGALKLKGTRGRNPTVGVGNIVIASDRKSVV